MPVSYSEIDRIYIAQDDGLGIPHGRIIEICTQHHTGKNYEKKEGDFSAGLHGSGLKGACACSEWFEVESYILGVLNLDLLLFEFQFWLLVECLHHLLLILLTLLTHHHLHIYIRLLLDCSFLVF